MSKTFNVIITEEDGGFVALNPDTNVASQGDSIDEALNNLKEALGLYFEETTTKNHTFKSNIFNNRYFVNIMPISGKQAIKNTPKKWLRSISTTRLPCSLNK